MSKEKITITRALKELKTLGSRIEKEIDNCELYAVLVGKQRITGYEKNEDWEKAQKATYRSVNGLIDRRNAIKSAITKSNSTTEVTIGTQKMTVADALERKGSIRYKSLLLNKMVSTLSNQDKAFDQINETFNKNVSNYVEAFTAKSEVAKKTDIEKITKVFGEYQEPSIIDPVNIKDKIESLKKEIDDFNTDVDISLVESNTRVEIEV